jgi:hypothetical protein
LPSIAASTRESKLVPPRTSTARKDALARNRFFSFSHKIAIRPRSVFLFDLWLPAALLGATRG